MWAKGELRPEPPTLSDDIQVVRAMPQAHFPDPSCRCPACSANRLADALAGEARNRTPKEDGRAD
jgi:hypothetical protein